MRIELELEELSSKWSTVRTRMEYQYDNLLVARRSLGFRIEKRFHLLPDNCDRLLQLVRKR